MVDANMSGLNLKNIVALMSFAMFLICLVPAQIVPAQAANADLSITSADITFSKDNPSSGEMITITAKVHNAGPSAASNVVVSFNVGSAPLLPTKTIAAIPTQDVKDATHNYLTTVPGTFVIKVSVTSDQSDPNTADNTAERSLTVGSVVPTVNITASLSSDTINSKDPFKVNGSAKLGTEPVSGGDVTIQIVQNGYTCTTKTNTDGTYESIMAGPTDQGVYTIKVTVATGAVSGMTQVNMTVLEADLTITKFSSKPTSPKEGDTVVITIGVQNLGNGTARNVTFVLKIDSVVVLDKKLGDLTNGQTTNVVYNWKSKKGSHTFDSMVDPNNNITEIKEDNNAFAQQTITVKAKANKPGPSFEAGIFIVSVVVVFFVVGKGRNRKPTA
jgi:hypothetical protein